MNFILAAEGGYQDFVLKGGEKAILAASGATALIALAVGFLLMRGVLAEDKGTPKMIEIALAIQEGALAYLKRQFRTIIAVLIPLAVVVFISSKAVVNPANGHEALSFAQSGLYRTLAFIAGAFLSGLTGFIGMSLATRGNVRTAAAAKRNSLPDALKVAFRTGGVAGMFTVGLGLLGATIIITIFQNTSSAILVGFGFGGSLLALFLRVGGGIFTKAADVGADLVGKVEAGIPEDDPRNPATIADNVGDNVGDCAGMASDLFESYEVTLVASIILGVPAFTAAGLNPALGLVFPLAARAIGVIASIFGVYAVKAKEGETNALKPINRGFFTAGVLTVIGVGALGLFYVKNPTHSYAQPRRPRRHHQRRLALLRRRGHRAHPRPGGQPPHRGVHGHAPRPRAARSPARPAPVPPRRSCRAPRPASRAPSTPSSPSHSPSACRWPWAPATSSSRCTWSPCAAWACSPPPA